MSFGGFLMTYTIGVVSQILNNMDQRTANFGERTEILNRIHQDYNLPIDLFLDLRKQINHAYDKDVEDLNDFISELPMNLRGKTAWYIHEDTWKKFGFFKEYQSSGAHNFLAWLALRLRPALISSDTELYHENDQV